MYPFSASALDVRLERGVVCDKCNAYFAKLEKYFTERHPGASTRVLRVRTTRKGKTPKFLHRDGEMIRKEDGDQWTLTTQLAGIGFQSLDSGDILITGTYTPWPFDSLKIGRVLAKIVLEYLYTLSSNREYDPFGVRFDSLRRYARFGPHKLKYVWFAWKRTQDAQSLPRLIEIQDAGAARVGTLCRISFPGVAYLLPLPPFISPEKISRNLEGWTVVDRPGDIELAPEKVEIVLNRVRKEAE